MGFSEYVSQFRQSKVNGESLYNITEKQLISNLKYLNDDFRNFARNQQITSKKLLVVQGRHLLRGPNEARSQYFYLLLTLGRWSIYEVEGWLKHWELSSLIEHFKKMAVNGALLLGLTSTFC